MPPDGRDYGRGKPRDGARSGAVPATGLDVRHAFVSPQPDNGKPELVQGPDWNEQHVLSQDGPTLLGRPGAGRGTTQQVALDANTMGFTDDGRLTAKPVRTISFPSFGAVGDGVHDDADAIRAALAAAYETGSYVTGMGLSYGVSGNIDLPDYCWMQDAYFVQLDPNGADDRRTLSYVGNYGPTLIRVSVDRNGATDDGASDGGGIFVGGPGVGNYMTGCYLENCEVYGDGPGKGIRITDAIGTQVIRPYVHDIRFSAPIDPCSEQLVGIHFIRCVDTHVDHPRVENIDSVFDAGVPSGNCNGGPSFTASIATPGGVPTMTVTAISFAGSGLLPTMMINAPSGAITPYQQIVAQLTGTPGGIGTYQLKFAQTVSSQAMNAGPGSWSAPGVPRAFQTDGIDFSGCTNATMIAARLTNCGEGIDVSGGGQNINVWFHGNLYVDIDSFAEKWIHEAINCGSVGSRSVRAGFSGMVIAGSNTHPQGPQNIRVSSFVAQDTGANGHWQSSAVAAFAQLASTANPNNCRLVSCSAIDTQATPTMQVGFRQDSGPQAMIVIDPLVIGNTGDAYKGFTGGLYTFDASTGGRTSILNMVGSGSPNGNLVQVNYRSGDGTGSLTSNNFITQSVADSNLVMARNMNFGMFISNLPTRLVSTAVGADCYISLGNTGENVGNIDALRVLRMSYGNKALNGATINAGYSLQFLSPDLNDVGATGTIGTNAAIQIRDQGHAYKITTATYGFQFSDFTDGAPTSAIIESDMSASVPATASSVTVAGTTMTVGGTITGSFFAHQVVVGGTIPAATSIVAQLTPALPAPQGGAGTYQLSAAATITVPVAVVASTTKVNLQFNGTAPSIHRGALKVGGANLPIATLDVVSNSANAFAVGPSSPSGTINSAFKVDASLVSGVTGLKVTSGLISTDVAAIGPSTNANLTINAQGAGNIAIGNTSTGAVSIVPALTLSAGGVTQEDWFLGSNNSQRVQFQVDAGNYIQSTLRYDTPAPQTVENWFNYGITAANQGLSQFVAFGTGGVIGANAGSIEWLSTDTWAAAGNRSSKLKVRANQGGVFGSCFEVTPQNLLLPGSISQPIPVFVTAAAYTVLPNDAYIICNFAGTVTLTLPTAGSWVGRKLTIKNHTANLCVSASSNVIPAAGTAAATAILAATVGKFVTLISGTGGWLVMENNS